MSPRLLLAAATLACWSFSAVAATSLDAAAPVNAVAPLPAPAATINPNAPVTHAELPALVQQAIMDNPQMLMDAVEKLHKQQATENEQKAQEALQKNKSDLVDDPYAPTIGSKNADVTMVEFFDYHCGYCKRVYPYIIKLLDNDKKLRVVFREFPILSADSVRAARTALAVNHIDPKKYLAFYAALMKTAGEPFTDKMLMDTAKQVGINTEKLQAALKDKAVDKIIGDELMKNRKLAQELDIRGTPGLVIGSHLFPGAMSYEAMTKVIADIRSGKDKEINSDAAAGPAVTPAKE